MLNNIRIVLVATSHPGNIGAVARAMKSMELSQLYLVSPKLFPHAEATARAAGADDILANAYVVTTLTEAISDCTLVMGTSARTRALPTEVCTPRIAAHIVAKEAQGQVAIVFGRESNGLSNDELQLCQFQIHIPTNPKFSSLNLAAAVQLIAYELKLAENCNTIEPTKLAPLATSEDMELFYQHLKEALLTLSFLDANNPRKLMERLRRLFNRARPEKNEINILRGMLTAIEQLKEHN